MKYIIEEDGLRIIRKGIGSGSEQKVDFEEIGSNISTTSSSKMGWFYGFIFFLVLGILVIILNGQAAYIYLIVSIISLAIYFFTKKQSLLLSQPDHSSYIEFIHTPKESEVIKNFIPELLDQRNQYLKEKYMKLDNLLPFNQQYANLIWLFELELISREVLEKKILELESMGIPMEGIERPGDRIHITGFTRQKGDEAKH